MNRNSTDEFTYIPCRICGESGKHYEKGCSACQGAGVLKKNGSPLLGEELDTYMKLNKPRSIVLPNGNSFDPSQKKTPIIIMGLRVPFLGGIEETVEENESQIASEVMSS